MADVWKSLPKHFCKFCKCWIADNKPSRDFHEKGKKHQENVKLKISEVRKKSVRDEEKKAEENSYMKEMEEQAHKAFIKDLKSDPKLAAQYLEKAKAKKETVGDRQKKLKSEEMKFEGPALPPAGLKSDVKCKETTETTWQIAYSPEGYPYYWNEITAEVSWTEPEGVVISEKTDDQQVETKTKLETQTYTTEEKEYVTKASTSKTDSIKKVEKSRSHFKQRDSAGKDKKQLVPAIDPSDISAIPLPGDIPLPPPPTPNEPPPPTPNEPPPPGECQAPPPLPPNPHAESVSPPTNPTPSCSKEERKAEEEMATATATVKRAHDSAYSKWETIVHEEPEQIDLQLPEVDEEVVQSVVVTPEPKLKFRQKKVDSLGAGLAAFKKRKMNNRSLKQRGDS